VAAYRIVLADDHALFREGIKRIVAGFPGVQIVGEASDGLQLLELLKTIGADMVILDLSMPNLHGIEAIGQIKRIYPGIKVLVLTMHKTKAYLQQSLAAGADGFLLKEDAYDDLHNAIRTIQEKGFFISSLLFHYASEIMIEAVRKTETPEEILSPREIEILRLVAEGKTSKEIAELLHIADTTVKNHRANMKKKLDLKKNADLIKYAIQNGYISVTR
jgi:DNA-binding NarL/FixJ family response regulator